MDQAQVSARLVAKVVLVVAGGGRRPLLRISDPAGHRALPDRRLLRGRDRPGGQLARPPPRSPLARDPARLPLDRRRDLRDRPADRAAAGQRRRGPLRRPARLRRRPAPQRDLPQVRRPLPHHREAAASRRSSCRRKLGDAAGTPARRHRRRLHPLRAAVLDPGDRPSSWSRTGDRLLEFVYRQLPPERARRMRKIADDISDAIAGYVFGQLRDQRPGGPGDLRDPADPRCAVRGPAGDPVRVLRPDPAGRARPSAGSWSGSWSRSPPTSRWG